MKTRHRNLLILFFIALPFLITLLYIYNIYSDIPKEIYVYSNRDTIISLDIPVTAVIKETSQTVNFSRPVTIQAKQTGNYSLEYKLFNLISLPSGKLSVLDSGNLYAGGFPVGFYLKTDGVLVADTAQFTDYYGNQVSPSSDSLLCGDYIVDINGESLSEKKKVADIIDKSQGETLNIGIIRNEQYETVSITPVMDSDGKFKLGIWVKDDSQGIGTVTYIDKDGNYGALGHGINDSSSGNVLKISNGFLYKTNILSITKGHGDVPGEYIGTIDYSPSNRLGLIKENTSCGVYGTLSKDKCDNLINQYDLKPFEIGFNYQVHKGDAYVQVYLNGCINDYKIEITDISNKSEKNITFKCVSEELLETTNGIVQGMSGCPIIQDGKIVGAVTHVFISDSTMGYGIFIQSMLNNR